MPAHDWSRDASGVFPLFHADWIMRLYHSLNAGLLPAGYYAVAELHIAGIVPDAAALQVAPEGNGIHEGGGVGVAVVGAPPRIAPVARCAIAPERHRFLEIRSNDGDRVVAVVEIVSPGNKSSRNGANEFVTKGVFLLKRGIHFLMLDVHAPGPRDPAGLHSLIWCGIEETNPDLPVTAPLTFASFEAERGAVAVYVDCIDIGEPLPTVPLFLQPGVCIDVPLEPTYTAAFDALPGRLRAPLEPPPA